MTTLGKQHRRRLQSMLLGAMACISAYAADTDSMNSATITLKPGSHLPMPGCSKAMIGGTPCTNFSVSVGSGSYLEIKNNSSATAVNISATIGSGLSACGVSVFSNACTPSLAPGLSCKIYFSAGSTFCAGDTICVSGTNTGTPVCIPTTVI